MPRVGLVGNPQEPVTTASVVGSPSCFGEPSSDAPWGMRPRGCSRSLGWGENNSNSDSGVGTGPAIPRRMAGGRRIWVLMIVEDDAATLATLEEGFGDLGYRVLAFPCPHEALASIRNGVRPDALVLDYCLPGLDGGGFLAKVKSEFATTIPTVVVSGSIPPITGYLLGVREFLLKPFQFVVLAEKVAGVIMTERVLARWMKEHS